MFTLERARTVYFRADKDCLLQSGQGLFSLGVDENCLIRRGRGLVTLERMRKCLLYICHRKCCVEMSSLCTRLASDYVCVYLLVVQMYEKQPIVLIFQCMMQGACCLYHLAICI